MTTYEESDEYCPHCDNHYVSSCAVAGRQFCLILVQVVNAKTPKAALTVEGEDARVDSRSAVLRLLQIWVSLQHIRRMIKDDRVKEDPKRAISDFTTQIG
jgi:hypothetical protein